MDRNSSFAVSVFTRSSLALRRSFSVSVNLSFLNSSAFVNSFCLSLYLLIEFTIELKELLRTESSSLPFRFTETSRFPFSISDVACVRADIGLRILATKYKTSTRIPIMRIPKSICNNIRFCDSVSACRPSLVTKASDEPIKLDANNSKFFLSVVDWAVTFDLGDDTCPSSCRFSKLLVVYVLKILQSSSIRLERSRKSDGRDLKFILVSGSLCSFATYTWHPLTGEYLKNHPDIFQFVIINWP
jgi:hypothetical protein